MTSGFPMGNGGIGIALQHSGDADYNEQSGNLPMEKTWDGWKWESGFGYLVDQASGYPGHSVLALRGIGIWFHVSEKLITGLGTGSAGFWKSRKNKSGKWTTVFPDGIWISMGN